MRIIDNFLNMLASVIIGAACIVIAFGVLIATIYGASYIYWTVGAEVMHNGCR